MSAYEYKVVPAPVKGLKAKGVRGHEARFAFALEEVMNRMGAEGWEYLRAETLPAEERHGLTQVTTTYRNVLVFRRVRQDSTDAFRPQLLEGPRDALGEAGETDTSPDSFFGNSQVDSAEDPAETDLPATSVLRERAKQLKTPADRQDTAQSDPEA